MSNQSHLMNMVLRITLSRGDKGLHHVEIALESDATPAQTAISEFDFRLSDQDCEDMRWYFEDYPRYLFDPAPRIAGRVERRIAEIGAELFRAVFERNREALSIWAAVKPRLDQIYIKIVLPPDSGGSIPWEFLRDPEGKVPVSVQARAFTRVQAGKAPLSMLTSAAHERGSDSPDSSVRMLLVAHGLPGYSVLISSRLISSSWLSILVAADAEDDIVVGN